MKGEDFDIKNYRRLKKGEIIREGDLADLCANPWHDDADWQLAKATIGRPASDPQNPAHTIYMRRKDPTGHDPVGM